MPAWDLLPARIVRTEDPEPLTAVGLKLAVTRLGTPATLRPTLPVNPCFGETETVKVPECPRAIVRLKGLAERLKSWADLTVSPPVTLWLSDAVEAVIVRV